MTQFILALLLLAPGACDALTEPKTQARSLREERFGGVESTATLRIGRVYGSCETEPDQ